MLDRILVRGLFPARSSSSIFLGIFAHYWLYVAGIPVVRTLTFATAALSTLALPLRVLDVI